MANHKLVFENDFEEPFTLIALHSSEEDYKIAYLINRHLNTHFKRRRVDIDFSFNGKLATFPIFDYIDERNYNHFYLVANKCRLLETSLQSSGGLFSEVNSEKATDHFLLPEFKKVDYFLKIYSDFENMPLHNLVSKINNIAQIVSAYTVKTETIKSKHNLIFD